MTKFICAYSCKESKGLKWCVNPLYTVVGLSANIKDLSSPE